MATFEEEIILIGNPKVGRKGWVARVDVDAGTIDFLPRVEGSRARATFEFEDGNFYIIARDTSSWKNSRQYYELYLAKDGELEELASISFENRARAFDAVDDDMLEVLKKAYMNAGTNKTTTALIAVAKAYAEREGITKPDLAEVIREGVEAIAKMHGLTLGDVIALLRGDDE